MRHAYLLLGLRCLSDEASDMQVALACWLGGQHGRVRVTTCFAAFCGLGRFRLDSVVCLRRDSVVTWLIFGRLILFARGGVGSVLIPTSMRLAIRHVVRIVA